MPESLYTPFPQSQESSANALADLTAVLQAVPVGITVFESVRDKDGILKDLRLLRRNELALKLSRIPADQYRVGALLSDLMPKELAENFERMLDVVRTGAPLQHELFQPHLNKWILSRVSPHGDGVLSTIQDITDIKRVGEERKKQTELMEGVLNASPNSISVFEAIRNETNDIVDFRAVLVNELILETSGYKREDYFRLSLYERLPDQRSTLPMLRKVVEEKEPHQYEYFVPATSRWVLSSLTPLGDGFVSTMQDITEQKEQRRIIEQQAQLFEGVLRSLQNGLSIYRIIRNEDGSLKDLEYLEVADSVLRDTGKTRAEMLGKRILEMYPGFEQTDYWAAYNKAADTGEPVSFETHFTLSGYDNYLLNCVTSIGRDILVNVYYIVNDLKQTQRELEHTVNELSRSNEDLEQFASIASHDLQEPLRKVQSFGAMLASRYGDVLGEDGRDLLNRMTGAAGRMRNLVTGLLAFARLTGDEDVPLQSVDLNTLVSEIIADLDQTAESAGGSITVTSRLPFVLGRESQLRHLFHNLLTNALKFRKADTPSLVSVKVGALHDGDASRLSPLVNPSSYLRLEVRDNGIGFEPEYSEKIFGLFERLHGLNVYQGTGLGLSICRRVAERHGGTIWAESQPGEGATFIVLLEKAS